MTKNEPFFRGIEAHPHILRMVLQSLRNPTPRANSGAKREDWRQPDLASCMRVSITFDNITAPLLYKRVITDDLYSLLENGDASDAQRAAPPAAHIDIPSKADLLGMVKHLDIEYAEPGIDLTYTQLMLCRVGERVKSDSDHVVHDLPAVTLWNAVDTGSSPAEVALFNLAYGMTRIMFALDILRQRGANGVYPLHLDTLSFCAQMGGLASAFDRFPMKEMTFGPFQPILGRDLIVPCQAKHVCLRSTTGYLGMATGVQRYPDEVAMDQRPHFTVHMQEWTMTPPLEFHSSTTFIHERPHHPERGALSIHQARAARLGRTFMLQPDIGKRVAAYDIAEQDLPCAAIAEAATAFPGLLNRVLSHVPQPVRQHCPKQRKVPVHFYGSSEMDNNSVHRLSLAEQREVLRRYETKLRAAMGEAGAVWDFRMDTLEHAPRCQACGA